MSGADAPMVLATPETGQTKTGVTVNGAPQANQGGAPPASDAQIAEVLDAANNGEIAQAREVLTKTSDLRVKDFAHHMIADHGKAESKLRSLDAKNGITPRDSADSNSIKAGGEGVMSTLRLASGLNLDRAYIDAQVDQHQKVLALIDTYLSQAQSADLRDHLGEVRTKVAQHLALAREIQAVLRP
jgi:putative membrane protein